MITTLLLHAAVSIQSSGERSAWTFRNRSSPGVEAYDAYLPSRDGLANLVIRCDVSGDRTLSIQYKPFDAMGLSMAPLSFNWIPEKDEELDAHLIWEPDRAGAYARDGIADRNASKVAEAIASQSGTLRVTASDREGNPYITFYDSTSNRQAITNVLAQCPWNP